jgi:hypothetical protein
VGGGLFNNGFMGKIGCFLGLNWGFMGVLWLKLKFLGFFMVKIGCLWVFLWLSLGFGYF